MIERRMKVTAVELFSVSRVSVIFVIDLSKPQAVIIADPLDEYLLAGVLPPINSVEPSYDYSKQNIFLRLGNAVLGLISTTSCEDSRIYEHLKLSSKTYRMRISRVPYLIKLLMATPLLPFPLLGITSLTSLKLISLMLTTQIDESPQNHRICSFSPVK